MLVRIVKLQFHPENCNQFIELFEQAKQQIIATEGCLYLELIRDNEQPSVFCTYSHWENERALNDYRNSSFFKTTWAKTKRLFAAKPIATSFTRLHSIEAV